MTLVTGPNIGLIVGGAEGEEHYEAHRRLLRWVDFLLQPVVISVTLTAPPEAPADGDTYIPAEGATGAWADHDHEPARWSAALVAWEFLTPKAGWKVTLQGTGQDYRFDSDAWLAATPSLTDTSVARTLALGDAGKWIRRDNAAANTITVPAFADVPFPVDTEIHGIQVGAGLTSIVGAAGVTINGAVAPTFALAGQWKAFTLKNVGPDEWDLIGALA